MYIIRLGRPEDREEIYNLLENIPAREHILLEGTHNNFNSLKRLIENLEKGNIILFTVNNIVGGYIEYDSKSYDDVWIYTLYIEPKYRRLYSKHFILGTFQVIKKTFKKDISYAVHKDNETMNTFNKYLKSERIRDYPDGRVEWKYTEKKKYLHS